MSETNRQAAQAAISWDAMSFEQRWLILKAANEARRERGKFPFKSRSKQTILYKRWCDLGMDTQDELYKLNWLYLVGQPAVEVNTFA